MFGIFYLPESPLFLFRKEQFGAAIESIRKIRGDAFNYGAEIAELQVQSDELDGAKGVKDTVEKIVTGELIFNQGLST